MRVRVSAFGRASSYWILICRPVRSLAYCIHTLLQQAVANDFLSKECGLAQERARCIEGDFFAAALPAKVGMFEIVYGACVLQTSTHATQAHAGTRRHTP